MISKLTLYHLFGYLTEFNVQQPQSDHSWCECDVMVVLFYKLIDLSLVFVSNSELAHQQSNVFQCLGLNACTLVQTHYTVFLMWVGTLVTLIVVLNARLEKHFPFVIA